MEQRMVEPPEIQSRAQGHHTMALGWLKRGRVKQAILSLNKAIDEDPLYLDAFLELGRILLHLRRWRDLAAVCRRGLRNHIEVPELHKMMITAIAEHSSLDEAYDVYELRRRDQRCINVQPNELLCCIVGRDEFPRLPSLLPYYRQLGVDRFLYVDNDSQDDTVDWLLEQPDVHVWSSPLSFLKGNFGSSWFELLLRRYGVGHWCLTIDTDEYIYTTTVRLSALSKTSVRIWIAAANAEPPVCCSTCIATALSVRPTARRGLSRCRRAPTSTASCRVNATSAAANTATKRSPLGEYASAYSPPRTTIC